MTTLREQARASIAAAVHAGPDDVVLFTGSGATAAINKLVGLQGGGTVDYVAAFEKLFVDYTSHLSEREEGGTPDILGDLRAGLAFQVKAAAGPERILAHDLALGAAAVARLRRHPRGPRSSSWPTMARPSCRSTGSAGRTASGTTSAASRPTRCRSPSTPRR